MNARNPAVDRIQILERPMALPAKCIVCGGVDRPVLDFQFDIEYYGAVYFCVECLTDVVSKIGYAPVAEVEARELEARNVIGKSRDIVRQLEVEIADLHSRTDSMFSSIGAVIRGELVPPPEEQQPESENDSDNAGKAAGIADPLLKFT
jgi:hypothetical protein